jgi:8-oxo-dGTP pyrophosphatase MutT (NUDIX family)
VLIRDGRDGLEAFMATRHAGSSFMPGALVFPGGAVDADDSDPRLAAAPDDDLRARVAGIRELFEEAGVLLAHDVGSGALVQAGRLDGLLKTWRAALCTGEAVFSSMMVEEGLRPATEALVPYAHWVTPRFAAKRFDTRFYLAPAPAGQSGSHDALELADSRWIRPADALAEHEAGRIRLVFVTRCNLGLLSGSATVADALAAAGARRITLIEPEAFDGPNGRVLRIPADSGYGLTEIPMAEAGVKASRG